MADSDHFANPARLPTPARPLLGLTILVVEDSRFACEAMRLLCLRSGARIRRADCLRSARRHLQVYRPSVIIVDLGLPDGSGLDLIRELDRAVPRVGVILGTSGDDGADRAARSAGADGFLTNPVSSLALFQAEVLSRLPPDQRPQGPHVANTDRVTPDLLALHDDLELVANALSDPAAGSLDYIAQFIGGVARSADDAALADAAASLAQSCARGAPPDDDAARIAGLVRDRLDRKRAI